METWRYRGVYPVELTDLNVGYYMMHFAFFEAVATSIPALKHAESIDEYYER